MLTQTFLNGFSDFRKYWIEYHPDAVFIDGSTVGSFHPICPSFEDCVAAEKLARDVKTLPQKVLEILR